MDKKEAIRKMETYCSYQERCHWDVDQKLNKEKVPYYYWDEVRLHLVTNNFIDEERFAKSYCRGKFKYNNWGKTKIRLELKSKKISEYCIKKGLEEINDTDYNDTILKLIEKKGRLLGSQKEYIKNQKIAKYLMDKGFESNLVWESLNNG